MSFFDSVDRTMLVELLQTRIADGSLLRLIGKCLHVGVLDGEEVTRPEVGTAQGSVLSPDPRVFAYFSGRLLSIVPTWHGTARDDWRGGNLGDLEKAASVGSTRESRGLVAV